MDLDGVGDLGRVELSVRRRLDPVDAGDELAAVSVGPDGVAIALWASLSHPRTGPVPARVTHHDPDRLSAVEIAELDISHPKVQPLPGGRILIVGARCQWRPEGPELNAVIFDANGHKVAEGTLGDGIEEFLTTPTGQIWVGYFDEGVYGNRGWEDLDVPPMGSHGLTRFTDGFEAVWQYPYEAPGGPISDVYSLNLDGEIAYSCYYTGFPLVRIEAGVIQTWKNTASGVQAIAVSGERCAMFGGYGEDKNRLLLGRLTSNGVQPTHEGVVAVPGKVERRRLRVVGRGSTLHFFEGPDWYSLSLDELPC